MDIPDIQVETLSKELLSLKQRLKEVVLTLERDGCLVLKGATNLTSVEPYLGNILDSVQKEIAINQVILPSGHWR
jgi:hypothetical protein